MRYVSEGKFYDIVEKEFENLKSNSDCGWYESCELDKDGMFILDTLDYEYYENFVYNEAYHNVLKKYRIKYRGNDALLASHPAYKKMY